MTRTTILLDDDLLFEIKQLARTSGTTATDVIREALKSYVEKNRSKRKLSFTAVGKSSRSSIAKDSEKILKRKANRHEGW
jgi:metal-responsive CopG/Arc/MetJ family transcriptional regulator